MANRSIWSYGLVKILTDTGAQPTADGDWSYGLLVEMFGFAAAIRKFTAEPIDTHFIAENIETHFIANPVDTHFIAEPS